MWRSNIQIMHEAHKLGIYNNSYHWSKEDEELLYNAYLNNDINYCYTLFPNRTHSAIKGKLNSFGAVKVLKWSEEELKILKENYSIKTWKEMQQLLPNRNRRTIKAKAQELGLKSVQRWTEEEIEILKKYYPTEGRECYKRLKNRNKQSCVKQARRLGLKTDRYKKVLCIETNEIFVSIAEASRKYAGAENMKQQTIGKIGYAGKLPDGTKLHWKYVAEGDEE